jgi:hypothetical protein
MRIFYRAPAGCDSGKKETESGQGERQRKRNMGFVYAVIWCGQPLPPFPLSCVSCLTCLRLWLSGQEVQRGDPPPCHPHLIFAARDLNGGSLGQPLISRSLVCKLILDSDGDNFLFSPLFDRSPVSRYIYCYSLAKISEFQADADILSAPKFLPFSTWRASTISRYSAGESQPIKAGWPEATPHLATACKGITTIWETKEIFSEVWEKSAAVDSAEPNSKGILLRMRQHFVNTRLFVDVRFLLMR